MATMHALFGHRVCGPSAPCGRSMQAKVEYVTPEGLRLDGRRPNELRRMQSRMGVLREADGSAYLEMGNTKVLVAVYGPREMRQRGRTTQEYAVLNCEFSMATFSTGERRRRTRGDRKLVDVGIALKQSFEAVVMTQLFPRSQIDIYVQVLQADGSTTAASINATTLAMIDAGIPMRDYLCACSVGFLDGKALLDINYLEEAANGPEMTIGILPKTQKVSFLEMEARLHSDRFENVFKAGMDGGQAVFSQLDATVRQKMHALASARGA